MVFVRTGVCPWISSTSLDDVQTQDRGGWTDAFLLIFPKLLLVFLIFSLVSSNISKMMTSYCAQRTVVVVDPELMLLSSWVFFFMLGLNSCIQVQSSPILAKKIPQMAFKPLPVMQWRFKSKGLWSVSELIPMHSQWDVYPCVVTSAITLFSK